MRRDVSRDRYTVEAVARLARVCALFSPQRRDLGLREIAGLAGIPLRTAVKIVATLERQALLAPAGDGRWALGPAWLRIADLKRGRIDVRAAAVPVMRAMREKLNETNILAIRAGDRRLVVECLISTQPVRRMSAVGDETPLHVGSSGRAMLAGLDDAAIAAYLARTRLVNCGYDTVTDPARIWSDIRKVRRAGWLTAAAEITKDSFSVSAQVRTYAGEVVAALTIIFPLSRLTDELRDHAIHLTVDGARRISHRLGFVAENAARSA